LFDGIWVREIYSDVFDLFVRGFTDDASRLLSSVDLEGGFSGLRDRVQYLFLSGLLFLRDNDYEAALSAGEDLLGISNSISDEMVFVFSRLAGLLFKLLGLVGTYRFEEVEHVRSEFLRVRGEASVFSNMRPILNVITAVYNLVMAYYYRESLDLDESLRYVESGLDVVNRLPDGDVMRYLKASFLGFKGYLLKWRGDLKKSFSVYLQSLILWEGLGNRRELATVYSGLADIYYLRGQVSLALRYAMRALDESNKVRFRVVDLARLYYLLVELFVSEGEFRRARYYLKCFQDFVRGLNLSWPVINDLLELAFAVVWLHGGTLKDINRSLIVLRFLLGRQTYFEVEAKARVLLLSGLFYELAIFENPVVASEIKQNIDLLFDLARRLNSSLLLVFSYWYYGKYELLVSLDFESCRRYLGSALRTAEVNGLNFLASRISSDLELLLNNRDFWFEVLRNSSEWRYKFFLLRNDKRRFVISDDPGDEGVGIDIPVALLIYDLNYELLFYRIFEDGFDFDSSLLGMLLQSLKNLGEEVFDSETMFELVKFDRWTVLVSSAGDLNLCYVYQGGSMYYARQRLRRFIVSLSEYVPFDREHNFDLKSFFTESKDLIEEICNSVFFESVEVGI